MKLLLLCCSYGAESAGRGIEPTRTCSSWHKLHIKILKKTELDPAIIILFHFLNLVSVQLCPAHLVALCLTS